MKSKAKNKIFLINILIFFLLIKFTYLTKKNQMLKLKRKQVVVFCCFFLDLKKKKINKKKSFITHFSTAND
jgi:hypothetical protein